MPANVLILVFNTDAIHWTGTVSNMIKEDNMDRSLRFIDLNSDLRLESLLIR